MDKFFLKKLIFVLLLVLLVSGAFLRLYDLGGQSYWLDEGFSINGALAILENGRPLLDSGKIYPSEVYGYPTALAVKLFGNNAFSYRFWPTVFGLVLILIIFLITKDLFGEWQGILAAFFTSFSYWQIAWSRQARWYTMFSVFFWLALWFFYKFLYGESSSKKWYFSLVAFFSVLASFTHRLGYGLPAVFLVWLMVYWWDKKSLDVFRLLGWLAGLLVILLGFDYWRGGEAVGLFLDVFNAGYYWPYYFNFILDNYWLVLLLSLLAVFLIRDNYGRFRLGLIVAPFLIYLIVLSFFFDWIQYRYIFHILPALFIVGSVGLTLVIDRLKNWWMKLGLVLVILTIFFYSGAGVWYPRDFYFLEADSEEEIRRQERDYYVYTPQPDFNLAYDVIRQRKKESDIVIAAYAVFNKIFLNEPGYWIKNRFNLAGGDTWIDPERDIEYYVGARVVDDLEELKKVMFENHGFIVLDFMSLDGRISLETFAWIKDRSKLIFFDDKNLYSKIWVYEF